MISPIVITGDFIAHTAREIYEGDRKSFRESLNFLSSVYKIEADSEEEKTNIYKDIILGKRDILGDTKVGTQISDRKDIKFDNASRLDDLIIYNNLFKGYGVTKSIFDFVDNKMLKLITNWVNKYNNNSVELESIINKDSKLLSDYECQYSDKMINIPKDTIYFGNDYKSPKFTLCLYNRTYENTNIGDVAVFQVSIDIYEKSQLADTVMLFIGVKK